MKLIDWKSVSHDDDMKERYAVSVYNRYQALTNEIAEETCDERYTNLITANKEIALSTLPKKRKKKDIQNCSVDVIKAREELETSAKLNRQTPTPSSQERLQTAKDNLDDIYKKEMEEYIETKAKDIEQMHIERRHAVAWETLRELTNKKTTPLSRIKGNTKDERLKNWYDHFKNLLGSEESNEIELTDDFYNQKVSDLLPIDTHPFTMQELEKCLKKVSNHKTAGPDNIPSIIWKHLLFHKELLYFCNETFQGNKPSSFSISCMFTIAKKGDLQEPTNYRGITLSAIASKIYNSLLLTRLSKHIEPILRRNQNGFRKGRSTLPQVLALRRIIEELRVSNKKASIVFVDFSKAFDSVNRSTMLHILTMYGVPEKIIKAIQTMYENPSTFVATPDGPTDSFTTTTGILQGDTLAPYLFIIVVDYILRQSVDKNSDKGLMIQPRKSSRHPSKHVTDLDYADDIALVADQINNAEFLLQSLERAAQQVGLSLNNTKTEYMLINEDANHQHIKSLDGTQLKEVTDFKYLGSYVSDSKKDFLIRKAQAWAACNKLHHIWKSNISNKTKISFFRACVESILLYGAETWTMKRDLEKRLDGTYTRLLMRVQNMNWRNHPTKEEIYKDIPPISDTVRMRRNRFAGHCHRSKGEIISDLLLWRLPYPKRGRRPLTYPDVLCRDNEILFEDLGTAMMDRNHWKGVVKSHLGRGRRK